MPLFGRNSLHAGEELGEELLVVRGEVDGSHAVDGGTDLFLEEVM